MTIGRATREDFSLMDCPERLNGPHCPHVRVERTRSAEVICCWCGDLWSEPRSQSFDSHGTYLPKPSAAREGRS